MKIEFVATVAVIAPEPLQSHHLYVDVLGLPLLGEVDGYSHSEAILGCKSFGIWPLSQAAHACFGTDTWPAERPVPQVSIEFDVLSAEAVAPAAGELVEAATAGLCGNRFADRRNQLVALIEQVDHNRCGAAVPPCRG